MRVVLRLSGACNMRCTYCYARRRANVLRSDGRAFLRSLDRVLEAIPPGQRHVVFFGGEPLLRFDLIRAVLKRHPDCSFTLNTNGTLIDPRVAGFLAENRVSVSLALDGTAKTHDRNRVAAGGDATHRAVTGAIESLFSAGVRTAVRMTVTPRGAAGLGGDVEYLRSLGAKHLGIAPASNLRWGARALASLEHSMCSLAATYANPETGGAMPRIADFERARGQSPASCRPGTDTVAIEPDGTLVPCHRSAVAEAWRLVVESDACRTCHAARYCTKCLPKAGTKRPGPRCRLKLAFARAYDMVRFADAGGKRQMEKYTVIDGKIYKIPPEVLKKYQLSEEQARQAQTQSKRPGTAKAEPPLKGNWYELGESDCF